jgi:hypothetical protein
MRLSRLDIRHEGEAPAPPAAAGDLQLRGALRKAADALTPVAVDPGPQFPRLSTFVDDVDGDGPDGALILRPVPAAWIPAAPASTVVLRSCDPSHPWMVTASGLRAAGADAARVDLRGATIAPLASRILARTPGRGRAPLVLAVPAGTEDLDGCVFPLLGLAASHCIVEATVPLTPGRRFDPVELIGNRRILRRAAATVLEAIPWIEHDGSRRFRCRLLLDASDGSRDPEAYDLFSQQARIARLLELACMLTTAGWWKAPGWPRGSMRFEEADDERLVVRLEDAPPSTVPLPVHVQIGCELFAVSYEMQVRPLRRRGAVFELTVPLVLRRRRRRREPRAAVPPDLALWVTFRNPVTGLEQRRAVRDLSFGGLCFEADPEEDVVWPGLALEEVHILAPERAIAGGEIEVRAVEAEPDGRWLCHAANRHADHVDDSDLASLLGSLKHPGVERHDGASFGDMLALYRRAGLLASFIERNLTPVTLEAASNWRRLHDRRAVLGRSFAYRHQGAPEGAVSAVWAWERTWLAQHFASSAAAGHVTGALHLAYLDFVLPRSDAHYLAFFVRAENAGMTSFYSRFADLTGTPEAMERAAVDYWLHAGGSAPLPVVTSPYSSRPLEEADEPAVAHAAERSLGRLASVALDFREGELGLSRTDERFQASRLRRFRQGSVVTRDGRTAVAVLREHTSPGVNLTWMLNASWVIPLHGTLDDGRATSLALSTVLAAPAPVPGGDRFVITTADVPHDPLLGAGFQKIGSVYLYVFSRAGLHRYYQYVADRYGEVDAARARRALRQPARRRA